MLAAAVEVDIAGSPQKPSVHPIQLHCPGHCDSHCHLLYISYALPLHKRVRLSTSAVKLVSTLTHSHYAIPPRGGWIILLIQSDGMVLLALPWPQAVAISLVLPLHHR